MADYIKRAETLPPEERTLDFPAKYTEICALYHFCVDLGIKCTIEHLYDGYAVRFPDGSDFAQHCSLLEPREEAREETQRQIGGRPCLTNTSAARRHL